MIEVTIKKQGSAESEKLWQKLCDFGDLSWFAADAKVESTGSGPGMVRRIVVPDGGHIDEKLESIDEQSKTLSYSIEKSPAFPLNNYTAWVTVISNGVDESTIIWRGTFDAEDIPESEARAMIENVYAALIDALIACV